MRLYKSIRLCLENKSKEFEKAGEYSREKEYNNSAVSMYYYSMFIRVSYIYKGIAGYAGSGLNSHQRALNQLKKRIEDFIVEKQYFDSETGEKISKLIIKILN